MTSWDSRGNEKIPIVLTSGGFTWEVVDRRGDLHRHEVTVKDGIWHEVQTEGDPARQVDIIKVERIGYSNWPTAGAVPAAAK